MGNRNYRLRPMSLEDLPQVLVWRNSERVRAASFQDHIITLPEHYAWFQRVQGQTDSQHLIFEFNGQSAGVINITQINPKNVTCYWGFYLGPDKMQPGLGTIMGIAALDYIFGELHIRKLCSEVLEGNLASISFHEKLGFIKEGRFREHVVKNGKYIDVICFGIFASEWKQRRASLIENLKVGDCNG